jgi:hypothetical protein
VDYFSVCLLSIELMGQQGVLAHESAGIEIAAALNEVFVTAKRWSVTKQLASTDVQEAYTG